MRIAVFFAVVLLCTSLGDAQWSPWTTSACVGLACFTGTRVQIRTCTGTCVGSPVNYEECLVPCAAAVAWSPYTVGECQGSPDIECSEGTRINFRFCEVAAPPYNKLPVENCPGGANASQMIESCMLASCDLNVTEPAPMCSEDCGNGYLIQSVTCTNTTGYYPDCLNALEYCNTFDCPPSVVTAWSRWDDFGECSSLCSPGVRSRTRFCLLSNGTETDLSECTLNSYIEYLPCNEAFCNSFTDPVYVCENLCEGDYRVLRECQDDGFAPRECLNQATNSTCQDLTDRDACGDPDIDLLFILDSSRALDDCVAKELELRESAPYSAGNPVLSPANFPTFHQQKFFAIDFINDWKSVTSSNTRVGLKLASSDLIGDCKNDTVYYLDDPGLRQLQLLDYPYNCDSSTLSFVIGCGADQILGGRRGDRGDKENFIIAVVPEVTGLSLTRPDIFALVIQTLLGEDANLFLITSLNEAEVTPGKWAEQTSVLKQMACISSDPVAVCDRFLGSIWEPYEDILGRFREQVLQTLNP